MSTLKLVIVLGFPNSGKTSLIQNLYQNMTGQTNWPPKGLPQWQSARCAINAKLVNVYYGSDGDDYGCVFDNMQRIATGGYDVAIIALSRSLFQYPHGPIHYMWEKWIDKSIIALSRQTPSIVFPAHERYYVHTAIPQTCRYPDYTGEIGTQQQPKHPLCGRLSNLVQAQISQLLAVIV